MGDEPAPPVVACVLRSGGDYDPRWVYALKRGVGRHLPEHRFRCLTDVSSVPAQWALPLQYTWRGWWSKMELFRPGVFPEGGLVLYLDLDTLVVGDLAELACYPGEFGMMTGVYHDILQSGVMAFREGEVVRRVWSEWSADPQRHMRSFRGDGRFLNHLLGGTADRLMDLYPGQMVSFKEEARDGPPPGARLVIGHGQPRFSSPRAGWAYEEWSRTAFKAAEGSGES